MDYQLYYLNSDPIQCAREHCDEHVKTQCYEIAMLLSYAYRCKGRNEEILSKIYSPRMDLNVDYFTWLSQSQQNWDYLYTMWKELLAEHKHRFDKEHVSSPMVPFFANTSLGSKYDFVNRKLKAFTVPYCKVPASHMVDNNKKPWKSTTSPDKRSALNSYREWYIKEFVRTDTYTNRELPVWSIKPVVLPVDPRAGYVTGHTIPQTRNTRAVPAQRRNRVPTLAEILDGAPPPPYADVPTPEQIHVRQRPVALNAQEEEMINDIMRRPLR